MSDIQNLIVNKLEKVEGDISDIKITLVKNTADMERHISRTDGLQDIVQDLNQIVQPMYEAFISQKAVEDYKRKAEEEKKTKREELIYKLKLPGYIVAALAAIGTILAWIGTK